MSTTRPFAYNTGSLITGTEQVGNLAIGIPTSGFSSTGLEWWNGPDEDLGYVIACQVPDDSQPTPIPGVSASVGFFRSDALTESSFINLTNTLFSQNFSSGADCKTYLENNGYWTSYPSIITSGLVVSLDVANNSSYSGSGSTWYNLVGGGSNSTLFNTPTYSSNYGGILSFDDASSEYATIPNIGDLSTWTVETWFRLSTALTSKVTSIVSNQYNLTNKLNFSIGTNNAPVNRNIAVGFYDGAWRTTTGFVPTVGSWYQVVGTYDGSTIRQYVNGSASGGTLTYTGTPQSGGEVRIMRRWDDSLTAGNLVDGDLQVVRIYNTALSAGDVLLNFNAIKSRFGL